MAQLPQQLRELFCQRYHCSLAEYPELALRKCLYWHVKPLRGLLRVVRPDFFFEDMKFIEAIGLAVDPREARADAANFRDVNRHARGFLRTAWRFRVSGRKALHMAWDLFEVGKGAPLPSPGPGHDDPANDGESLSGGPSSETTDERE